MAFASIQSSLRAITGTTQTYEGDWHAYCDKYGFPAGSCSERIRAVGIAAGLSGCTSASAEMFFLQNGLPNLALDLTGMSSLPSGVTFSRADASTCATYFGSDGLLKTAAANVPRFDYDPVTKLPKGLLIEESRANLLANPAAPYTSWTDNGSTATAGASALGLFSNTAIVASGGQVYNRRNTTLSAAWVSGTTYAWTVFVIPGTSGKILIDFRDATAVTETQITGTFPATPTATATAAGAATVIGMVSVGGGVYQITGTFTPNSTPANGGASMFGVGPNTTTVGQNITVLGAQVEVGAFPTSFINGQLTRAADSASMAGTNFSSWFNGTAGTFVVEWDSAMTPSVAQFPHVFAASDGTTTNTLEGYFTNSTANSFEVKVASVSQALVGLNNVFSAGVVMKSCGAYASNNFGAAVNGNLGTTGTSGALPTATTLYIGANGAGSAAFVNGHIRRLAYYPTRLSNSLLQTLTA